jgi:valyl-tRNA synthetase
MLMMGNFFKNKTPFYKVYVHALVRDEKGQKMSKSKGNVIDPLELINEYGADSLRFTLISMASPGRDVKLAKDRVIGNRNFITKIWSANNFLKLNKCKYDKKINIKAIKLPINQWIYNEFVLTQNLVSNSLENFRFDEAAKHIYQFVWHSYCDWYLEFLKPIFTSRKKSDLNEARLFSSFMMANILKLLHPFIPFFTETVWANNDYKKIFKTNLILSKWPEFKKINNFRTNCSSINHLIEFISNIRSSKSELKITPKLFCDIYFLEKSSKLNKIVQSNLELAKHVGRISNISDTKKISKNTIEILSHNEKISLSFNESIDLVSQKNRIYQKIENLNTQINSINNKLKNAAYIKNAPKEIVKNDKKLLKELTIEDSKLRSIVSSIN